MNHSFFEYEGVIPFNTVHQVSDAITNLDAFQELCKTRHKIGKTMIMEEFLVLKSFLLDQRGGVWKIVPPLPIDIRSRIPDVCTWNEFTKFRNNPTVLEMVLQIRIPSSTQICPVCNVAWTIAEIANFVYHSNRISISREHWNGSFLSDLLEILSNERDPRAWTIDAIEPSERGMTSAFVTLSTQVHQGCEAEYTRRMTWYGKCSQTHHQ